jgi:hypothetical protein
MPDRGLTRRRPCCLPTPYNPCMDITLPELEQAINYWRALRPSTGEERTLSPEVNRLATVYAKMIFNQAKAVPLDMLDQAAQQLLESWRKASSS